MHLVTVVTVAAALSVAASAAGSGDRERISFGSGLTIYFACIARCDYLRLLGSVCLADRIEISFPPMHVPADSDMPSPW